MEIFLEAADSQDGFLPQEGSPLPDPSLQREQHANDQQPNPKYVHAPRSIEGDARGEGGKQKRRSSRSRGYGGGFDGPAWLAVGTFVHEVWLCLQHANILLNPLCQRLDRRYGVALVSSGFRGNFVSSSLLSFVSFFLCLFVCLFVYLFFGHAIADA